MAHIATQGEESNGTPAHRSCPQCDAFPAAAKQLGYGSPEWEVVQCPCGFIYLANPVSYECLADSHSWSRTFAQERADRRQREPVFSALSRGLKTFRGRVQRRNKALASIHRHVEGRDVLDIGCGYGELLQLLPERFIPFGIEIDAVAAAGANRIAGQRGGRVWSCDALKGLSALEDDRFDGILMHSYLEHESRPREVLAEVSRVLRPGGKAIIKVPNYACWNRQLRQARWCGFRFPDHVNYFTPRSLTTMLRDSGLGVVGFHLLHRLPTSDNMWAIATPVVELAASGRAA